MQIYVQFVCPIRKKLTQWHEFVIKAVLATVNTHIYDLNIHIHA